MRDVAESFEGTSLVALDQDELRARLEELPSVESVRFDRAFPHTLRIVVVPEEALAVVKDGSAAWLVSGSGRVIRSADPETRTDGRLDGARQGSSRERWSRTRTRGSRSRASAGFRRTFRSGSRRHGLLQVP